MSYPVEAPLVATMPPQPPEADRATPTANTSRWKQILARSALALSMVGGGVVAGAASEMAESDPAAAEAVEFVNDYPYMAAQEHNISNYDWWLDENGDGQKQLPEELKSPMAFYYRNCTDGVAHWVKKYTGVAIPGSWGNASNWDNAATGYSIKEGNANNLEPGDIAQSDDGTWGHVGFVTDVEKDSSGVVTEVEVAEINKSGDGNFTHVSYTSKNSSGKFIRWGSNDWDHFIDVNGANRGLNNETLGSGPSPTPLPFVTHPSAIKRGSGMDVFYKEHDGDLANVGWNPGSGWRSPQAIAGNLAGNPDAIARDTNNMEVAFVDNAGNLRTVGWNSVQNWGEAIIRASDVIGDPEIITRGNGMELFWRTDGGSLMTRGWNPDDGWMPPRDLATGIDSNPTAVARGTNDMAVFYRDGDDLYEVSWNVNRNTDGGWSNPVERVSNDLAGGDPVVISRSNSEMSVFYRDKGNRLDEKGWSAGSGWRPVSSHASNVLSDPSATARGWGAMEIAFKSINKELRAVGWTNTHGWGTPQIRGSGVYGEPHIINRGTGVMEVFYKQTDHLTDAGWNAGVGWGETDVAGTNEIA